MPNNPEDYELFHYGVKGMKWGVRKNRDSGVSASNPTAQRKYDDLSNKERRKTLRIHRKTSMDNYNKAADWANAELIPAINKKYSKVKLVDADGNTTKSGEKYYKEYNERFNTKLNEITANTIREKTKGRINLDPTS